MVHCNGRACGAITSCETAQAVYRPLRVFPEIGEGRTMDLLFKRAQTGATGISVPGLALLTPRPKFKLWAKIECTPEEQSIIDHYHFSDSVLVEGLQIGLLQRSSMVGFWSAIASTIILLPMFGFRAGTVLCLIVGGIATYLYYDKHREIVFVRDLLAGRHFTCASVVELARKEAWLEVVVAFLRQVMESAKHWDGTETLPIDPMDRDAAKQLIIKGL